jgi:tetratricopeptide (TPR) repeat protein
MYNEALTDLNTSLSINPTIINVLIYQSIIYFEQGNHIKALHIINKHLMNYPRDMNGIDLRSTIYSKLNKKDLSIKDKKYFIQHAELVTPEKYLELANIYIENGIPQYEQALMTLKLGLQRFNNSPIILRSIIKLSKKSGRTHDCLEHLDKLISISKRKENLQFEKALLLIDMGELIHSEKEFKQSLASINKLPLHYQRTPAIEDLLSNIKDNLLQLEEYK